MKKFLAFVLCLALFLSPIFTNAKTIETLQSKQSEFRAFYYNFFESGIDDAKNAIDFAVANSFKAIFFETTISGESVYPSRYLINAFEEDALKKIIKYAKEKNVRVYAVVNVQTLSQNPASITARLSGWTENGRWNLSSRTVNEFILSYVKELVSNYNLNGIVIDNFWYENEVDDSAYAPETSPEDYRRETTENLILSLVKAIKKIDDEIYIGVTTPSVCINKSQDKSGSLTYGDESFSDNFFDARKIVETGLVDFICPKMTDSIYSDDYNYLNIMEWWTDLVDGSEVSVIPFLMTDYVNKKDRFDKYEIVNQIQINRNLDSLGHVLYSYPSLVESDVLSVISPLYKLSSVFDMTTDLSFESSLKVAQPGSQYITTTYDDYYIAGTCDPDEPLFLNGEEFTTVGEDGVFGVFVELEDGENEFLFEQWSASVEIVINKKEPTYTSDTVNVYSMFPYYDDFVYVGDLVKISCKGPANAEISAKVGDEVFSLSEVSTSKDGTATYETEVELKNYKKSETTNLGKIIYTLKFNGKQKEYKSPGRLFYVGENSRAAVVCIEDLGLGTLYKKPDTESDVDAYIYTGVEEYIIGSSGDFFISQSGGYISKASVDPVDGVIDLSNEVKSASLKRYEDYEKLTLKTDKKSFFTANMTDTTFSLTLYNTENSAKFSNLNSKVLGECSVSEKENSVTYTFKLKGDLWGYHVDYEEDNTIITLKYPPIKSDDASLPLKNVVVVVDPGHGREDIGATGPAGKNGANEKDLNMAVSAQLKLELENLGAKVYVTRTTDIRVNFEGRLGFADAIKPDFFISIHHNATAINVDSTKSDGFEIYYHWEHSKDFANNLYKGVMALSEKTERGVHYADYRVTRMYYAPSVLVECGFMLHPFEYSSLIKKTTVKLTAKGLANGVVKTMEQYGK